MKKWFASLLTLSLLLILSYFCFINKSQKIKNDLLTKANVSYAQEDMDWLTIGLEGEDVTQRRVLVLEGIAQNQTQRKKAERIAHTIEGIYDVQNNITVPYKAPDEKIAKLMAEKKKPIYKLSVSKEQGYKVVLIKGVVPNNKVHQQLIQEAKKLFGEVNVIDELEEKAGTPTDWYSSAKLGLEKLSSLKYGRFEMRNTEFNFQGYAQSEKSKLTLLDDLEKHLNSPYKGKYEIQVPPIKDLCQKEIRRLLSTNKIYFHYNSANIKKSSYPLLNNLAHTVKNTCLEELIVIEGHTDAKGKKAYNQKLSTKRANHVKNYLVQQGVPKNRIEAIGYGESRPIASNKTKKGKKRNRRIEFKIKILK